MTQSRALAPVSSQVLWVEIPPPFGESHAFGCCNAYVNGTACGFPRNPDGSCCDGHPPMPVNAKTFPIHYLRAASRVASA